MCATLALPLSTLSAAGYLPCSSVTDTCMALGCAHVWHASATPVGWSWVLLHKPLCVVSARSAGGASVVAAAGALQGQPQAVAGAAAGQPTGRPRPLLPDAPAQQQQCRQLPAPTPLLALQQQSLPLGSEQGLGAGGLATEVLGSSSPNRTLSPAPREETANHQPPTADHQQLADPSMQAVALVSAVGHL